jgi:hypothetical protein
VQHNFREASEGSVDMAGGRPLKFKSVKELQEKIEAYFAECDPHPEQYQVYEHRKDEDGKSMKEEDMLLVTHWRTTPQKPYTITGLAVALDTSRQTLLNYEERDEFFDTIKRAKDKCESWVEENMLAGKSNPTGSIFSLKNNYGWKDRSEQDITSGGDKIQAAPLVVSEIKPRNADAQAETEASS